MDYNEGQLSGELNAEFSSGLAPWDLGLWANKHPLIDRNTS